MRWLLANPLRTLSPLGLVAVGAAVGVAGVPVVKKTARNLAVLTVRGVLAVSDVVKDAGSNLSKGWEDMVQNVRETQTKMDQQATAMDPRFETKDQDHIIDLPKDNKNIET